MSLLNILSKNNKKQRSDRDDSPMSVIVRDINKRIYDIDCDFDEMDERIKERRALNGKPTHHEIDLWFYLFRYY